MLTQKEVDILLGPDGDLGLDVSPTVVDSEAFAKRLNNIEQAQVDTSGVSMSQDELDKLFGESTKE